VEKERAVVGSDSRSGKLALRRRKEREKGGEGTLPPVPVKSPEDGSVSATSRKKEGGHQILRGGGRKGKVIPLGVRYTSLGTLKSAGGEGGTGGKSESQKTDVWGERNSEHIGIREPLFWGRKAIHRFERRRERQLDPAPGGKERPSLMGRGGV